MNIIDRTTVEVALPSSLSASLVIPPRMNKGAKTRAIPPISPKMPFVSASVLDFIKNLLT